MEHPRFKGLVGTKYDDLGKQGKGNRSSKKLDTWPGRRDNEGKNSRCDAQLQGKSLPLVEVALRSRVHLIG